MKKNNKLANIIERLILLTILISPIAVFVYYLDSIESSELFGFAVIGIPVILILAYMLYHNSWRANNPRKAMEELEENQRKS